ncbi:unnamed protein product [Brachionus calyciflorus]|uniref:C2 domain-containing protein n=1 Tax=Brachionus calyciflorus TaxID=104777 RepID=A0A813VLW1_9BILA|nr:unnamed protein product [Brachionus calyciflorus]
MLSKYMCIPFYYNEGYGLGDVTSDEDENSMQKNARLELNSIVPLKKYYPSQKIKNEPSKLSTSAISSTDIFRSIHTTAVQRTESTPIPETKNSSLSSPLSNPNSNLLSNSALNSSSLASVKSTSSPSCSPKITNSLLSVSLLKKLSFNHESNEITNQDCQDFNNNNNNNLINSEKKSCIANSCQNKNEDESDNNKNNEFKLFSKQLISPTSNSVSLTPTETSNNSSPGLNQNFIDYIEEKKSAPGAPVPNNITQKKSSFKDKVTNKSKRLKKMIKKASRSQSPSISKSYEEDRRQYFLHTYSNKNGAPSPIKNQPLYEGQNFLSPRKQSHLALSLDTYKRMLAQKLSKEKAIELDDSSIGISSASSSPKSNPKILKTAPSFRESFSASNTPLIVRRLTKQSSIFDSSFLSVNPSGRICLRFIWDKNTHVLTVTIIQSNKILMSEKPKIGSKIQFHVTLLNKDKSPKYKTTTKEYNDIINFDENFYFPNIEKTDFVNTSIAIYLHVKETFGSHKVVSQAIYNLSNVTKFDQYNYVTLYFEEIKKKSDSNQNLNELTPTNSIPSLNSLIKAEKPELLIGLRYDALLGNLLVKIIRGNNFIDRNTPEKSPNTYVKVVLIVDNNETKYQTSLKKSTSNPVFDESFEFNLAAYQVENAKLSIYIYSKKLLTSKSLIGCIIFDDQPGHNEYVSHLRSAIASEGEIVQKWHSLIFY